MKVLPAQRMLESSKLKILKMGIRSFSFSLLKKSVFSSDKTFYPDMPKSFLEDSGETYLVASVYFILYLFSNYLTLAIKIYS